LNKGGTMLNVTNAHKNYDNNIILKNVRFSLDKGQITALAGPSGSGKSTLLRCIQGLQKLDTGTVDNTGSTGFVFQDFQLFPHLNVLHNVMYALKINQKISNNDHQKKAKHTLKQLGLQSVYAKMPSQLSGGQRQRAAIARALVLEPDLLLCDEPTSGLDGISSKNVAELFKNLKNQGVTMLIASHDLDFVSAVADRIIVLNNAVIVKDFMIDESNHEKLSWNKLLG
jgi:polar amino acid transport system ATP-binding protein